ncbi:heparin lyase I family protein [Sorangium sp. So ce136]|uniref:heparin lyase I family protein n=1 Tax=Sorangium sp. So ce136 TaxID=3133284 RepID=UPI003EFBC75C
MVAVRPVAASALLLALGAAPACNGDPVDLGPSSEFRWWTDHESGDLSDWSRDGRGGTWTAAGGELELVTAPVRSGAYAVRSTVTSADAARSESIALRGQDAPGEAFYSAWFHVPEFPDGLDYWLLFKFRSRSDAGDPSSGVEAWDLVFARRDGGSAALRLYRHGEDARDEEAVASPPVLAGRWFQIEAFLRPATDETGALAVYQDGVLIYDVRSRPTMPSTYVEWNVGGVAEASAPRTAVLFFDDAAISTVRLGPTFPAFYRAP